MSGLTKNQILDYKKWYMEKPDPGFSPERNKYMIEKSIIKSKLLRERRSKDYIEKIRERADAVATYLKAVEGGKEDNVDRYFGRKMLAHLRGQKILEEVKGRMKKLFAFD